MLFAILVIFLILGLVIWEIWVCEGTHLGRNFVVWMYDIAASRYEKIKQFDPLWERKFLGEPLAIATSGMEDAILLDVGAGTGRIARTLSPLPHFQGTLISLEPSRSMMTIGRRLTTPGSTNWVQAWAVPLPFSDETFDVVCSLETLEFTPQPLATLAELIRVLRKGGSLLVTNRVSREARLILGRTFQRDEFLKVLEGQGLIDINVLIWQVDYDLAWARKP